MTVDVAWSPVGIDQRFYDYLKLSYVSDFLFIMSYDEQSQIYGECVAGANSGFYKTLSGMLLKRQNKNQIADNKINDERHRQFVLINFVVL